jgi:hypothetical protein
MIYESGPWRDRLLRAAKKLAGLMGPTKFPQRRGFAIERVLFLSAFTMRKLWESNKLSQDWKERTIPCRRYNLIGEVPTVLDRHDIDEFYDLKNGARGIIEASDLCNLLIHSFVVVTQFRKHGGLAGLYVASDRSRHGQLLWIGARDLYQLLQVTGHDVPASITLIANAKGQFDVVMGKNRSSRKRRSQHDRKK